VPALAQDTCIGASAQPHDSRRFEPRNGDGDARRAIGGPIGIAPGVALGGALGALAGAVAKGETPLYELIRAKLERNSFVAVLLADPRFVYRMLKELGAEGVVTFHRQVSEELRGRLEDALTTLARQQAQPAPP
jgi:hypothetical protein